MSSFTPFRTVKALDEYMDWINTGGAAEKLCQYKKSNAKPPSSVGDEFKRNPDKGNHSLGWKDEFLLTLSYLYSGLDQEGVAAMFGLESDSTVSRIYTTWVLFLLIFFRQVMATPTEDQIHASYPKSVINIWKDARTACLYDCTEFRMQAPSERVVNAILYSTYKNCHTSKVGIGCTPTGYVPAEWISACFGGRASDYTVTEMHGILDTLYDGCDVQVDKGFFIEALCLARDIHFQRPIKAQQNTTQFAPSDVAHGEKSSVTRIVIEQVNRRIKEARFFKGPGQLSQSKMFSRIIFVIGMFGNLRPPVVGMD